MDAVMEQAVRISEGKAAEREMVHGEFMRTYGSYLDEDELRSFSAGDSVTFTARGLKVSVAMIQRQAKPTMPEKRPWPVVRRFRNGQDPKLMWAPESHELTDCTVDPPVRAGESFSIVRPGWERWPLGIASDHYKVFVNHLVTDSAIREHASQSVTPMSALMAGHGYHVAHSYSVKHGDVCKACGKLRDTHPREECQIYEPMELEGARLSSRLVVAHSYTGKDSMVASMCIYIGATAMGSVIHSEARHVASQPARWAGDIDAMIHQAVLVQGLVFELFLAAKSRKLTDVDRDWLKKEGYTIKDLEKIPTLLEAMIKWHEGHTEGSKMTWGVWARRLGGTAIETMCELLGFAKYGTPIDLVLGGHAYGKQATRDARRAQALQVAS